MRKWFASLESMLCAALVALAAGCAPGSTGWARLHEATPAFLREVVAEEPSLASDGHGLVALTWVTRTGAEKDAWIAISRDSGATFARPGRINLRRGSVWSDPEGRPISFFAPGGRLVVAWSDEGEDDSTIVDLLVRTSDDGGRTFAAPVVVNDDVDDDRSTFHGRAALAPLPDGALFAVWTDDRERRRTGESTSLFYASSGDGGKTWSDNRPVTSHACACCRPAVIGDGSGLIAVAYRTAVGARRDPALAISRDGGTNFPFDRMIDTDDEHGPACPAAGPALDTGRGGGWVAWARPEDGGAWLAQWTGDGEVSARRALVEGVARAAHTHLAVLDGATLAAVEGSARGDSTLRTITLASLSDDGAWSTPIVLGAGVDQSWVTATGPRTALVVWRERGRLRLTRVTRS